MSARSFSKSSVNEPNTLTRRSRCLNVSRGGSDAAGAFHSQQSARTTGRFSAGGGTDPSPTMDRTVSGRNTKMNEVAKAEPASRTVKMWRQPMVPVLRSQSGLDRAGRTQFLLAPAQTRCRSVTRRCTAL